MVFLVLVWIFSADKEHAGFWLTLCLVALVFSAWSVFGSPKKIRTDKIAAEEIVAPRLLAEHHLDHPDHARHHNPELRLPIRGTFVLDYSDVEGERSHRVVDAKNVEIYGQHLCLNGFCHLRRDMRMFRADRIISLTDQATGEIVEGAAVDPWLLKQAHFDPRDRRN